MPKTIRITVCVLAAGLATMGSRSARDAADASPILHLPLPELKPAPSTPIAEEKAILGDDETWRPEWDALVEKALPHDMLTPKMDHKVAQFCPRFGTMSEGDRRAFWAYVFQALSGAEAGLKATANVQHFEPQVAVVDGVSHRMVRSEGLLQLTYEDSTRYGCNFDWNADKRLPEHDPNKTILQPGNNLLCGVNILNQQLILQKKPLLAASSYWSALRPSWPGNRVFLKQMRNIPAACGRRRDRSMPEAAEEAKTLNPSR